MNRAQKIELNQCPCGETPAELSITYGDTYRWRYVSGNCQNPKCPVWMIEIRVDSARNDEEITEICIAEWNKATNPKALPEDDEPDRQAQMIAELRGLIEYEADSGEAFPIYAESMLDVVNKYEALK